MDSNEFQNNLSYILNEADPQKAFYWLSDLYCLADEIQRGKIRQGWAFDRSWKLPDPSTLACQIPGGRAREQRIRASLIYNSIEDFRADWRDNLVSLCRIYHSALRTDINVEAIFREIASLSSENASQMITDFIERSPEGKSLEAFFLREMSSPEGIRIELDESWPTEEEIEEIKQMLQSKNENREK